MLKKGIERRRGLATACRQHAIPIKFSGTVRMGPLVDEAAPRAGIKRKDCAGHVRFGNPGIDSGHIADPSEIEERRRSG